MNMKHLGNGENNMSDFWDTAPILALLLTCTIFLCGLGFLMYVGLEQEQIRYEQCVYANMQWVKGSCVK